MDAVQTARSGCVVKGCNGNRARELTVGSERIPLCADHHYLQQREPHVFRLLELRNSHYTRLISTYYALRGAQQGNGVDAGPKKDKPEARVNRDRRAAIGLSSL